MVNPVVPDPPDDDTPGPIDPDDPDTDEPDTEPDTEGAPPAVKTDPAEE